MPFDAGSLKVEKLAGSWVVRDAGRVLYAFGPAEDAARSALALCRKHGFNQMAVVGAPDPVMTYMLVDPLDRPSKLPGTPAEHPLAALDAATKNAFTLPEGDYAGSRTPIDARKLDLVRAADGGWQVADGPTVLAKFGLSESTARLALRALQDTRATEVVRVGKAGVPVLLAAGHPVRGTPIGFTALPVRSARLEVKQVGGAWCAVEGDSPLFEFADRKEDADLMVRVMKHFDFDQIATLGQPENGGIRLLVRGR